MNKLYEFYLKYKTEFNTAFVAVFALLSAIFGWQANQTAIETRAMIEAVRFTPTAAQSRQTPTSDTKPTNTPVPGVTLTPTKPAPTSTPLPGATNTPVILPTVTPTSTQIVGGGLPLCAEHDPNVWHALISADGSCHYDHEHKHDPNEGCAVEKFGKAGEWFNGSEISYFWQTNLENAHKHYAYGYVVRCNLPDTHNDGSDDGNPNYIKTVRVQYHLDPMPFLVNGVWGGGYIGTQHSYSVEVEVCRKSDDQCGIGRWGGWLNNGDLELRDADHPSGNAITQCAPLPDMEPENCPHGPGGSRIAFDNLDFNFPLSVPIPAEELPRGNVEFWYGEPSLTFEGTAELVHPMIMAMTSNDFMVDHELDTLMTPDQAVFCPKMDCHLNGSTISLHELSFNVSAKSFDGDGDGFANANLLVDQYLRSNSECTAPEEVTADGLMCIPFVLEHMPIGFVEYGDNEELTISAAGTQDFDLSPAVLGTGDEWWITWAIGMLEEHH